jgi:hypothetical protein
MTDLPIHRFTIHTQLQMDYGIRIAGGYSVNPRIQG